MTVQPIGIADLTPSLAGLASSRTTVAIVARGEGAARWETDTAWEIALGFGVGDRRVALIDLFLDDPQFQGPGSNGEEDGIVDAFEYGVSLSRVAQPYEGHSVFFIPAGSPTADPEGVLGHPRWERLAAGFRKEGAVLVLYLPAAALPHLRLEPELIMSLDADYPDCDILVAPPPTSRGLETGTEGEPKGASISPQTPALESVDEAPKTPPERSSDDQAVWRVRTKTRRYDLTPISVAAIAVALGGIVAAAIYLPGRAENDAGEVVIQTSAATPADTTVGGEVAAAAAAAPRPTVPARNFDADYPFVLQTASYSPDQQARAVRLAEVIERAGTEVILAPTDLKARGRWHRVMLGPFPDRASSAQTRDRLRATRTIPAGNGLIIRAPYSLEVHPSLAEAAAAAGLDTYLIEGRLLIGAFEEPEHVDFARQLLDDAELPSTLVQRLRTPE